MSEDIDPEQKFFAHKMLKARIYSSNGAKYEALFVDVMTKANPEFRAIKPQGLIGDQGNDGFIPEDGCYFQCYSPEDPARNIKTAAAKASDDFDNIIEFWNDDYEVKKLRFVFNDKYLGSYPDIEHELANIVKKHNLQSAKCFLAKDLEDLAMGLPFEQLQSVIGSVIPRTEYIQDIDYAVLTEILQHLVDTREPISDKNKIQVPDFGIKIKFNNIGSIVESLLTVGNFQNAAVDSYFERHGSYTKIEIRDHLANAYQQVKSNIIVEPSPDNGDQVFFSLLNLLLPAPTSQGQDAAIVLMSYFFEKCDIFEDPS